MIHRPRFAAHLHVNVVKGRGIVLVSQIGYLAVKGRVFEFLAPLIDGRRSTDDIAEQLQDKVPAAEVYYAMTLLDQKGYIRESGYLQGFTSDSSEL